MFYIYSKTGRDYKVYDDKDLSMDICSVEEIRSYLGSGIKITGVSLAGNSLKLCVKKPSGLHITLGLVNKEADDKFRKDFKLNSNTTVYAVYSKDKPVAIFAVGNKNCLLFLNTTKKADVFAIFECMFKVLEAGHFKGIVLAKHEEAIKSVGADLGTSITTRGYEYMVSHNEEFQIIEREPIGKPVRTFTITPEQLHRSK